jgi:hypothetical protein
LSADHRTARPASGCKQLRPPKAPGRKRTCPPKALSRRWIAAHESPRTTKLYDRTTDQVSLDEIGRIAI